MSIIFPLLSIKGRHEISLFFVFELRTSKIFSKLSFIFNETGFLFINLE